MCIDVSVVIPVFNTKKYLRECLDSVLEQSGVNYEVICVDDESTDGSYNCLLEYQKRYSEKLYVFRINHKGISEARNYGFQKAKGKYIYYVDSDDILKPNALLYMYEQCETYGLDIFFFSFENFADDADIAEKYADKIQNKQKRSNQKIEVINGRDQFVNFINKNEYYVTVWCQCIRKEYAVLSGLSFPKVLYFEDQIYTFQALTNAQFAACSSKNLYLKRIRKNSVCTFEEKTDYIQGNMQTIFFLENRLAETDESVEPAYYHAIRKLSNDSKIKLYKLLNQFSDVEYQKYLQIMYEVIEREYKLRNDGPLVSVCIPTAGIEKWVLPVLDSIYVQGVSTDLFEVIVTNNGSYNEVLDKEIEKLSSVYGNIKYEYNNSALFLNEIEAYKLTRGKMIKFVNHRTLLDDNALKTFLITSFYLCDMKPVLYFSNGVLKKDKVIWERTFDDFLRQLGYWSSWSTGMCFWKEEFDEYKNEEVYNELFPHTNILLKNHSANDYLINDRKFLTEIPTGNTKKGEYDVFHAYAVVFPEIFQKLKDQGIISTELFLYIKQDILQYIAFMYHGYVLQSKKTAYDLSGFESAISKYFSKEEVLHIIEQKYPSLKQKKIQCRMLVIEYTDSSQESMYDAKTRFVDELWEKLTQEYKFVRVDSISVIKNEQNEPKRRFQMRRLLAYLDGDVKYVVIKKAEPFCDDTIWLKKVISEFASGAIVYEKD